MQARGSGRLGTTTTMGGRSLKATRARPAHGAR
jgi:hypothetical protein